MPTSTRKRVAVAALLLCGAAPAATVQAQNGTPSAPRNLEAEAGDTWVRITWDPPSDNGGSDLTGYQMRGGLQTTWVSIPETETGPASFSSLENGQEYTFEVRAVNANGEGDIASVKATPLDAPSAPRNLAASPGDAQVTLTWSAPSDDGGTDVTSYEYQVDDGGWQSAGAASARSVVVSSGLENGTSYTFSLRAVNDVGGGAAATVDATPQAAVTAPSAPRNLAAEEGDSQVTLTWSPPANDGGANITGYEYQVDQGGWQNAGAADARSVVVSSLENLRQYTFSLRALNGGTDAGAAATVDATPRAAVTAPSAPRNLEAEAGDTVVRITWDPPADDGGSDLTAYQMRGGLQTTWATIPATETGPANFSSLENGQEYTFEVRAVNEVGEGPIASVMATPRGAPSAPRNLTASPGNAQVTLTWSPPADDGGSDITGYEYQVDQDNWQSAGAADARSIVVSSGLENGTSYTFSLRALNGVGDGAVATVDATPRTTITAPSAPRNLAASTGNTRVTLTWEPPANDGGADITGYEYQVDQGNWQNAGAADARSVAVSNLENLREYTFSVRALNGGTAPGTAATVDATPRAAATAPTAPRNLEAEAGDTVVRITWDPPADDGGSALTGYQMRGGLQTTWVTIPPTENGPANFGNLENGREYTFEVRAVNDIGPGPTASVKATPRGTSRTPSSPRNLIVSPGNARVKLTWEPPADDGGSAITGYQYQVDRRNWEDAGRADARSVVVSDGIENGREHRFSVRAMNASGPGVVEAIEATPRPEPIAPTAPRNLLAEPGDGIATLTWSPPANDGGSTVTRYQYRVDRGDWVDAGRRAARPVVVRGLENGRQYAFSVRAVNRVGPGPAAQATARLNGLPAFGQPSYAFELPEHRDGSAQPVELGHVTAEDPDGGALTYVLSAGDRERFAVRSRDGALTYIGPGESLEMEPNRYDLTVVARDALGAEALARVVVTVTANEHLVEAVAGETLAAMGRGLLASARMTLGRRAMAGRGEQSRLTSTNFLLAQGNGNPRETRPWRGFTVWGQGDVQMFRGAPSTLSGYEGDVRTTYLGIDSRLTDRWLAGVAVARSWAAGDWHAGGARGRMTTTLTAVQPYVRWSNGATSVWTMVGGGGGAAVNERAVTGGEEASGLGLRLGVVEVRRRLGTVGGGVQFGLRGDAAWAQLTTEAGNETIDALRVAVSQVRAGVELTRPFTMSNGLGLAPFGELNMRRDGGAGQNGDGLELAGGLRASRGAVRVDAQARLLALHSADGYQERGASVTFSVGEGGRRPGLTLSLAPRWGDQAAGGALWQDHVYRRHTHGVADAEQGMDARVDYGVRSFGDRLLTPFGVYGQSQYGRWLQFGLRLSSREGATGEFLQLEMSGERYRRPGNAIDNRVSLSGLITFGGRERNVEAFHDPRHRTVPR